ncbi:MULTISPECIES: carbohydrate ABC transporter permease [unclassified Chelatococcus]|uniref:carbohydrate ABC transporter permease n=1 Tax=unclassified Chelatococcus TaxID=2638111 RepID=UPI001BCED119|nr:MULTISPECIES: carbohydrate ABC transporter permease [unclassified Chelatococcus]CAH1650020.1 Multiple sugar transport system permease protein [Hyphomicrobiales bacterium]MBS7743363.1 carbohydrate ABC transporter permease [Chelatococcus sp. HY11]MBX3541519.1 carbohydrate ABC transporter permease [Chelatococcus sp.]MCO5074589.1 carbohydrate ABC transporter permease [Chelatococcus sp.]CAH1692364.1 Multiple sugar transport system permease protein [Hyphomicrobiales bacterium]
MRIERLLAMGGRLVAVALILIWSLFPIAFVLMSSLKPAKDIFAAPPKFVFEPTVRHYMELVAKWGGFFDGLLNSFIVTVGATLLAVVTSVAAGYIYSRHSGRFLTASAVFLIVVRLIPPIAITLPLFPVVNWLRLNDTHLVLILLYATFFVSLGTLLMRTFIDQVPRELDEAALIDGASRVTIMRSIILPIVAPGILAVSVFVVVFAWNEFLFAFVFTATRAKTAPLVISEMIGSIDGVDWGILFAAATVQLVPVLLFVAFMHRYLVAGLTAGATKG